MELYEMHKVKDENGRPIWYLPKEVESKQTLTLDKIQEINYSLLQLQKGQERVAAIQEEVARIQRETVVLLNVIKDQLMS